MSKIGKFIRKAVVSDEIAGPIVQKATDVIGQKVDDNVIVPDVRGIDFVEAEEILKSYGFNVITVRKKEPNKEYIKCDVNEIVDMEYSKPNPILKGIPKGSLVKIFYVDKELIEESKSWKYKIF